MGNWMTVQITGTIAAAEVAPLREKLRADYSQPWNNRDWVYGPLTIGFGVCGINEWPAERIDTIGNVYERDFTPMDVVAQLEAVLLIAPSMNLKIHCGGDHESETVVNTITVANGKVALGPPEIEELGTMSEAQMKANLLDAIYRQPQW